MLLADVYKLPVGAALGVIAGILLLAVIASVISTTPRETSSPLQPPLRDRRALTRKHRGRVC